MFDWYKRLAVVLAVAFLAACGGGDDDDDPTRNITQIVVNSDRFTILEEAVIAAGLDDDLAGTGPFTVFAPTDAAFAALLTELGVTKEQLLADTALLTRVLTYHVVPANVKRRDVPLGKAVTTLETGVFKVEAAGSELVITDESNRTSRITDTDIAATNGTIHVIDKVILPTDDTVVEVAAANSDFATLVAAVQAAGLADTLSGPGPFTVFAPTNEAFAALLTELGTSLDDLVADTDALRAVLLYHVVEGRVLEADVQAGPVDSLGGRFTVGLPAGGPTITDARNRVANIVATDVFGSNGVIHVIDKVILPPAN